MEDFDQDSFVLGQIQWRALVTTVKKVGLHKTWEMSWLRWLIPAFRRRTVRIILLYLIRISYKSLWLFLFFVLPLLTVTDKVDRTFAHSKCVKFPKVHFFKRRPVLQKYWCSLPYIKLEEKGNRRRFFTDGFCLRSAHQRSICIGLTWICTLNSAEQVLIQAVKWRI